LIAGTSVVHAEEQSFSERKANLAEVHALRVGYGSGTVRIVLDVTKPIEFTESYAENPSRLILDLKNTWLNPTVQREIEIKSLAAKKVRIAQFNPSTVRIVIETMAETRPFNLSGGTTGHRFVIDVGNAEYKENPELNKPEPAKTNPPVTETVKPPKNTEVPTNVEVMDPDDLRRQKEREIKERQEQLIKEQREREKQLEKELKEKEKQDKELKEQQERELKEKQEQLIKEQREREKQLEKELKEKEKQEKELKKQQERELKEKQEQLIKEQREREKQLEKERKEKEKQDKLNKKDKDKNKDKDKDKNKDKDKTKDNEPFGNLENDLDKITTLKGKIIVIDPGHGGNDSGAIGPTGVMEKAVTLNVALELRKLLIAEGAEVIMTRETDKTVSYKGAAASDIEELGARCEIANRAGADIFISIHADSFTRPEARGTTGYYYSKSTSGRGQKLADCIRRNLVEQLGTPSRGTQPCNFYVVRHTDMPATLIELGFISNRDEEKLLDSKEGVQRAAQGILDGIEDYFG
jgi:N-acetylmuramoyl-L-alanine amidase CwlD